MSHNDKIKNYVEEICRHIRWKRVHKPISTEIENHIIDQKEALLHKGFGEEESLDLAINEMGSPQDIGLEFDKTYKPKTPWSIIILIGILIAIGFATKLLLSFDLNKPEILTEGIFSICAGFLIMVIAYFLDFTIIGKYPKTIFFAILAVALFYMQMVNSLDGRFGVLDIFLLLLPTAFAGILYDMRKKGYIGIIICGILFLISAYVCLMVPSFSFVILYGINGLILMTYSIIKRWWNITPIKGIAFLYTPIILFGIIVYKFLTKYHFKRFQAMFNPSSDPMGAGYVGVMVRKIVLGGKLIGESSFKDSIPAITSGLDTSFVLTYLINRLGWISIILIVTILISLIIKFKFYSGGQKSILGKMVTMSILLTYSLQMFFYIANNVGIQIMMLPNLPFISYTPMSMIINMFLMGLMMSAFRNGHMVSDFEIKA